MISRHHRLVFVHIPKCAGMTIEAAMGGLSPSQRTEQHFSGHDYARYHPEVWGSFHRFTVVRHPVARAMSFARFIRRYDPVMRKHLGHLSDVELLTDLLMSQNLLTARGCAAMLTGDEEVLRLEELDAVWPAFAERHHLPDALPHVNASPTRAGASEAPPRIAHMVEALFPDDFDRFGYARHPTPLAELPVQDQGAVCWAQLRTIGRRHGRLRTQADLARATASLDAWVAALPEEAWRDRWHRACLQVPIASMMGQELGLWTELVHDAVNDALGKPLWQPWSAGN